MSTQGDGSPERRQARGLTSKNSHIDMKYNHIDGNAEVIFKIVSKAGQAPTLSKKTFTG
jgi:hypothetical protein